MPDKQRLFRAKNYLDLDDESRDEQRDKIPLTDESHLDADKTTDLSLQSDLGQYLEDSHSDYANIPAANSNPDPNPNLENAAQQQTDGETRGQESEKLHILRHLLSVERRCNQQRKLNAKSLQRYIGQLQCEYLRQQREVIDTLQLARNLKVQKEAQLKVIDETLKEKDKLIDQLRQQLEALDESKLRAQIEMTAGKQSDLFKLEKEQLKGQVESIEQQLVHERVSNSQTLQQFQEKLTQQEARYEQETEKLRKKLEELQFELKVILEEPQNLAIKNLKEEKRRLEDKIHELNLSLEDHENKYNSLRTKLETLIRDQEHIEQKNEEEMNRIQEFGLEQRRLASELRLELDDKLELIQILQFNLQRSEKRAKNLMGALKSKEETHKEITNNLDLKHEQEVQKLTSESRLMSANLIEKSSENDKKTNEILRLKLEHENQIESLRNDRDLRINKLHNEKQTLEKELKTIEMKFARELELNDTRAKQIEQAKAEAVQFREESKRLSIELTKCEAKLFAKQKELDELGKEQTSLRLKKSQIESNDESLLEARRYSRRLETSIEQLKKSNERLTFKLRISESNLIRLNSAISREQSKMQRDYDRKLEQIKLEQMKHDKHKLRYKKYGTKLKHYCSHLRQIHDHICNSTTCGYIIWDPMNESVTLNESDIISSRLTTSGDGFKVKGADQNSLMSNYYEEIASNYSTDEQLPAPNFEGLNLASTPIKYTKKYHDKFAVKRTGNYSNSNSPHRSHMSKGISRNQSQRSILKQNVKYNSSLAPEATGADFQIAECLNSSQVQNSDQQSYCCDR